MVWGNRCPRPRLRREKSETSTVSRSHQRSGKLGEDNMALFDALINDLASRYGLGANAAPLVREVLNSELRT